MKVREVFSEQCVTTQPVDFADLSSVMRRMQELADQINAHYTQVAEARAVKECHGDRMKRALAVEMRQLLLDGESASRAEALARSSEQYGKTLASLQADLTTAETILQQHDARRVAFDAQRSALACLRHAAETY